MVVTQMDVELVTLSYYEASTALIEAGRAIRGGGSAGSGSPADDALIEATSDEVSVAFLDTLRVHDVTSLSVDANALADPATAVPAILRAGQDELRARGIPDPDVDLYRRAGETAGATGEDVSAILSDLRATEPLVVRGDLPERGNVAGMEVPDTVSAVPEIEGPVGEVAEYDVHFMAYPLGYKEIAGVPVIDTQPSHAFVVVTEKGGNPLDRDDVLIAARAGPDNATETVYLPDSSLPDGEQSETEKTDAGNVYASDQAFAISNDVEHPGAFHVETITVTDNVVDMQALVEGHRRFINGEDIDYELVNRNSNTYAGDIYELLTGEEPPTSEWARLNTRYFPAVNNDLVDYEKTPYADRFDDGESGFVAKENVSYGLD